MNVALVTGALDPGGGGIAFALDALAGAISLTDKATVSVLGERSSDHREALPFQGAKVYVHKRSGPASLLSCRSLTTHLDEADTDIAHSHGLWMALSRCVQRWSSRNGRPFVVSPHGMLDPWALQRSARKKMILGWMVENRHLHNASCVHALNSSESRSIREYGLVQPIAQIPNGVDLPDLTPTRASANRTLLFLGRIHPKKGLKELLDAWTAVQADSPHNWRLTIAGWDDGGYVERLRLQACALSGAGSVDFVGPKFGEEKKGLLRSASAFILPSFSEGLPMAVLEAWSYGLPVVMTDHCNLPEGFAADAALRVDPRPDRIAEGLRTLFSMSDADLRTMGGNGRALVEQKFAWPEIARQMVEVYAWVLGGGARPACVVTK